MLVYNLWLHVYLNIYTLRGFHSIFLAGNHYGPTFVRHTCRRLVDEDVDEADTAFGGLSNLLGVSDTYTPCN